MNTLINILGLVSLVLSTNNNDNKADGEKSVSKTTSASKNGKTVEKDTTITSSSSLNVFSGLFVLGCVALGLSM